MSTRQNLRSGPIGEDPTTTENQNTENQTPTAKNLIPEEPTVSTEHNENVEATSADAQKDHLAALEDELEYLREQLQKSMTETHAARMNAASARLAQTSIQTPYKNGTGNASRQPRIFHVTDSGRRNLPTFTGKQNSLQSPIS